MSRRFTACRVERDAKCDARQLDAQAVQRIRTLHHEWLSDGEIAERVRLGPLVAWHARMFHGIDRHRA